MYHSVFSKPRSTTRGKGDRKYVLLKYLLNLHECVRLMQLSAATSEYRRTVWHTINPLPQ